MPNDVVGRFVELRRQLVEMGGGQKIEGNGLNPSIVLLGYLKSVYLNHFATLHMAVMSQTNVLSQKAGIALDKILQSWEISCRRY